jgi:hypothetical protein
MRNNDMKTFNRDETRIFIAIIIGGIFFLLFLISLFFIPFNSYISCYGTIDYRDEIQITSATEGTVVGIPKKNYDHVDKGEKILNCQLFNDQLYSMTAPASGNIYFNGDLYDFIGSFLKKGQILAYIYKNDEKIVKAIAPLNDIDKVFIGQKVLIYYKDPYTFISNRVPAKVYAINIDKQNENVILFCQFLDDPTHLVMNQKLAGTPVKVKMLVAARGLYQNIFLK